MAFKELVKDILPPVFLRFISGFYYGWHGDYSNWKTASVRCSGYDSGIILEKVKESTLKVKDGTVPYERDSVIFNEIQYSYPLLSGLMWIAGENNGKLNVLDFGGSLGSSYYQNKLFLDTLTEVKWCIVEQPGFVEVGKKYFENEILKFYFNIDECLRENNIHIVLLSSVLQYIEYPYDLLKSIIEKKVKYILFDRTQFISGNDRITIQRVNPSIYNASYPCWFFDSLKFKVFMSEKYDLIYEFDSLGRANIRSEFKGFLYRIKIYEL
jgi:putative methyltransferase (TIGR04325 family)